MGAGEELAGCREVEEVSVIEGAEAREEFQGEVEVAIPISQGHSVGVDLRSIGGHGVLAICSLLMRQNTLEVYAHLDSVVHSAISNA